MLEKLKCTSLKSKVRIATDCFKRPLLLSDLALTASAGLSAGNAQALLLVEFFEQGADARVDVSGSLTGLPAPLTTGVAACFGSRVRTSPFNVLAGCVNNANEYSITGPTSIGSNTSYINLSGYAGDDFFIPGSTLAFAAYIEGDTIVGSGLLLGQSFSSLGLNSTTPGDLLASWTIGTDTIEARIGSGVPVPGPLPLFGAAAAFAHSRRLRARLRAGSSPQA